MEQMSEFISKLEGYRDLEVSIIRTTKINKVLKAILKLPKIPQEAVHSFKKRSQKLLDQWNKLLASSEGEPAAATNGEAHTEVKGAKASSAEATDGTKDSSTESKTDDKIEVQSGAKAEDVSKEEAEEEEEKSDGEEKPSADETAGPAPKDEPTELDRASAEIAEEPKVSPRHRISTKR